MDIIKLRTDNYTFSRQVVGQNSRSHWGKTGFSSNNFKKNTIKQ